MRKKETGWREYRIREWEEDAAGSRNLPAGIHWTLLFILTTLSTLTLTWLSPCLSQLIPCFLVICEIFLELQLYNRQLTRYWEIPKISFFKVLEDR